MFVRRGGVERNRFEMRLAKALHVNSALMVSLLDAAASQRAKAKLQVSALFLSCRLMSSECESSSFLTTE